MLKDTPTGKFLAHTHYSSSGLFQSLKGGGAGTMDEEA